MIMTSKIKRNPNIRFLKCSKGRCGGWQWLDEANLYSQCQASFSNPIGCYCIKGHRMVDYGGTTLVLIKHIIP